jgi:hypothetical protein
MDADRQRVCATYIQHEVSFYVASNMAKKVGLMGRIFYCIIVEFSVHLYKQNYEIKNMPRRSCHKIFRIGTMGAFV